MFEGSLGAQYLCVGLSEESFAVECGSDLEDPRAAGNHMFLAIVTRTSRGKFLMPRTYCRIDRSCSAYCSILCVQVCRGSFHFPLFLSCEC